MWILIVVLYLSPGPSITVVKDLTEKECNDYAFETGGDCFIGEEEDDKAYQSKVVCQRRIRWRASICLLLPKGEDQT